MSMSPGVERDIVNNQKRMIRELKRIADALEDIAGSSKKTSLADYISLTSGSAGNDEDDGK